MDDISEDNVPEKFSYVDEPQDKLENIEIASSSDIRGLNTSNSTSMDMSFTK